MQLSYVEMNDNNGRLLKQSIIEENGVAPPGEARGKQWQAGHELRLSNGDACSGVWCAKPRKSNTHPIVLSCGQSPYLPVPSRSFWI